MFVALMFLTLVTVTVSYLRLSVAVAITVALIIATIKASLVASYFMHLISEKKAIYGILVISAIFFVALGGLTLWGMHDQPAGSQVGAQQPVARRQDADAGQRGVQQGLVVVAGQAAAHRHHLHWHHPHRRPCKGALFRFRAAVAPSIARDTEVVCAP